MTTPSPSGPDFEVLTPGQREAVAAMTEAERAQLAALKSGRRASLLAPFADRFEPKLFEVITRRELKPPKFLGRPEVTDRSTAGLVAAVADGDPRYVAALAESLVRDFGGQGDRRRWGAIHHLAQQLHGQAVAPEDLLDAHRQAMGPKSRNRGAVFTHALRRTGWAPGS